VARPLDLPIPRVPRALGFDWNPEQLKRARGEEIEEAPPQAVRGREGRAGLLYFFFSFGEKELPVPAMGIT